MKASRIVGIVMVLALLVTMVGEAKYVQAQVKTVQPASGEGWLALARKCGMPNTMASADALASLNGGGSPQLGKAYNCPGGSIAAPPQTAPLPTAVSYVPAQVLMPPTGAQTYASPPQPASALAVRDATCTLMGTSDAWFYLDSAYTVTYANGRTSSGFYRPDDGRCSNQGQPYIGTPMGPIGVLANNVTIQQVAPGQSVDPSKVVAFPWMGTFRSSVENARVWAATQANNTIGIVYNLLREGALVAIPTAAVGSWAIHAGLAAATATTVTVGALAGILGGGGLIVVALALISRGAQVALGLPTRGPNPTSCRRTEICLQATCGNSEGCRSAMCQGMERAFNIMPHLLFCVQ